MKEVAKRVKDNFWAVAIIMAIGFGLGKLYTYNDILTDCKVLGNFRFGYTPIGCHVGEKA